MSVVPGVTVIGTRGVLLDMHEVDVTGEVCPRPALIVRRRLSDLDAGEELLVRGDYPPAEENLRRTCEKHGFDVSGTDDEGEDFELRITVTDEATVG
jgi:tRNA 2-thiouridine synthesizing protein A